MLEVSELSWPGVHFILSLPLVTSSTRAQAGAEQEEEATGFLANWPCKGYTFRNALFLPGQDLVQS